MYIVKRKVDWMKKLLLQTDHYCYQICDEVGFGDITGGVIFKRITGLTMEKYRERTKTK
jgi:YesN/AraC family two-component response regulator